MTRQNKLVRWPQQAIKHKHKHRDIHKVKGLV